MPAQPAVQAVLHAGQFAAPLQPVQQPGYGPPMWTWPEARRDGFLRRAFHNHALNYARDKKLNATVFVGSLDLAEALEVETCDANMLPNSRFRQIFWEQVQPGLDALTYRQQLVLLSRYSVERSVLEIAAELGCSPHAVEECLSLARRRLREYLVAQAVTEGELRSYL